MPTALPHPNTYWVPGGRLMAGEYPFTEHLETARPKLRDFVLSGITCFLDLTEEDELDPYEPALREIALGEGLEIEYHRIPIRDMGIPDQVRMRRILDLIDRVEARGGIPYVHCWGGIGRTGTVVGCYLIRRGMAPDAALKQVGSLFATMSADKIWRHPEGSPQHDDQRDFVLNWSDVDGEGEVPKAAPPLA